MGRSLLAVVVLALCPDSSLADEIKVLCSNGMKAVIAEAIPRFEQTSTHKVRVTFGVSAALARRIEAGEAFDVAVLTAAPIDAAIQDGRIRAASRTILAQSPMSLAVRAGAPKPLIDTAGALERALRQAKAIAYAREGASAPFFRDVLRRLSLSADVAAKIRLTETGAEVGALVARGDADLGVLPLSEILPIPGIEALGPFPGDLKGYLVMVAGQSRDARRVPAGAFIDFMTDPAVLPLLKAKGMERPTARHEDGSPFAVFSAQQVDDTRVAFMPPGIDWERAAPAELRRLRGSAPDAQMAARLRDHLDDFGHAALPYDVAVPSDMRSRAYVLLDAGGAAALQLERLTGTTRVGMSDPAQRDVQFFGEAVARPAGPRQVGGGFVLAGVSERDIKIGESRRRAADLVSSKVLEAAGSTRFWNIVKQYELRIAGDSAVYVFVQWAPDDEIREAGCQSRFTLFKLTPAPVVVASTDYGCDV